MKTLMTLTALLCLSACGGDTSDKKEESVFDPLVQNIDKAKAVEDKVMQQKDEMDKAIRKAEDGTDAGIDDATSD